MQRQELIHDYRKLKEEAIQNFQFVVRYFKPYSSFIPSSLCGQIFNEVAHQTRYKIPFEQKFMYRTSIEAGKIIKAKFLENPTPFWEEEAYLLAHVSTLPLLLKELTSIERFFILIEEEPDLKVVEKFLQDNPTVEKNIKKIVLPSGVLSLKTQSLLQRNDCFSILMDCILGEKNKKVEPIKIQPKETTNSVSLYVNEINQIPLLTKREEMRLGQRILAGSKEAVLEMTNHNLRLSVFNSRYLRYNESLFLDSIQEGNISLMQASKNYNWLKNYNFSTCAFLWLRSLKNRYLKNYFRNIFVSDHTMEKLIQIENCESDLAIELGRIPTIEEVANRLNRTVSYIQNIKVSTQRPFSIEAFGEEVNEDSFDFFEYFEIENNMISPEEAAIQKNEKEFLQYCLEKLSPIQKEILTLHYGLDARGEHTFEQIGNKRNVSRQSIQPKEAQAIKRLRNYGTDSFSKRIYQEMNQNTLKPMEKLVIEFENLQYDKEEIYSAIVRLTDQERTTLLSYYEKKELSLEEVEEKAFLLEKIRLFLLSRREELLWKKSLQLEKK